MSVASTEAASPPESALRVLNRSHTFVADAAIVVLLLAGTAIGGSWYYGHSYRSGRRPFFYQSYYEPAVMSACGKGFLVTQGTPIAPALRAFLLEQTDRFSCDQLPADLRVGTEALYQRPWLYLMTTVAWTWRLFGISWSGLGPLFGVLFGATIVAAYAVFRQIAAPPFALVGAGLMAVSPLQLSNLPNLRDYAKAPFAIVLILLLIVLALRPWRTRDVLIVSLCYGLVLGFGYGFRTDLLIDIPSFLITVALFLPDGIGRHVAARAAAVALFAIGFVCAAWPLIRAVSMQGGCQWHFFLLGLTDPFDAALGVRGGSYSFGHLYNDEYLWAMVSSYAGRMRPDLGYIEYCSHAHDIASWDYLRQIVTTFPADMLTRGYASAMHVLGLPFERLPALSMVGPALTAAFVVLVAAVRQRLAWFTAFMAVYFAGYPSIQFQPRHYFPFEVLGMAAIVFALDGVWRAVSRPALRATWRSGLDPRRGLLCALTIAAALLVPLFVLRAYQSRMAKALLASYQGAETEPLTLVDRGNGSFRLADPPSTAAQSKMKYVEELGRARARLVAARLDPSACRPGTELTFRYDGSHPEIDFSKTVRVPEGGGGPTQWFEPVFDAFVGVDVSDSSPSCRPALSVLSDAGRFPLLLPAQLGPDWRREPEYRHVEFLR